MSPLEQVLDEQAALEETELRGGFRVPEPVVRTVLQAVVREVVRHVERVVEQQEPKRTGSRLLDNRFLRGRF